MEKVAEVFVMAANHPGGTLEDIMVALILVGGFLIFLFAGMLVYEAWFRVDRWFSRRKRNKYLREISLLHAANDARFTDEYDEAGRRG